MKHFSGFLIVLCLLLAACDSTDENRVKIDDKIYMPLSIGNFHVYAVDETTYTLGAPTATTYNLKVRIADAYINAEGDSTFVIHQSTQASSTDPWIYKNTVSARYSMNNKLVWNEENVPYVKLEFPVREGLSWDGNLFNTLGEDNYELSAVKTPFEAGAQTYPDCVTVIQSDNDDFIVFLDQRKEVYSRTIGLVYKETQQLSYCTQPSCLGKQQVESGVIYKQTLTSYGKE